MEARSSRVATLFEKAVPLVLYRVARTSPLQKAVKFGDESERLLTYCSYLELDRSTGIDLRIERAMMTFQCLFVVERGAGNQIGI
jgi:hypothetical protein